MSCPSPRATPPDPLVVISANVRAGNVENHSAANSAVAPSYSSDYGSDFTPEEEDLLNALVDKFATEADILKTATPRRLVEARKSTPGFELEPGRGRGGVALNLERRSELAAVVTPDIEASNVFISTLQLGEANSPGGGAAAELSPTLRGILEIWDTLSDFEIESVAGGTCVEHADSEAGREKDRREELDKEEQRQQEEASKVQINEDVGTGKPVFVDPRSPLERFRKAPRKNLSVTDLVSPAWCELQYWYSLTKFGRKRPTPAMKQGTAVHKTLEEQVHTTVEVQVSTREDGWALRLWNIIQGLHTLRTTGMTRELEVWGVIDGEMVTGIIDELSYNCPDPELEASTNPECPEVRSAVTLTPEDCMSISDYLLSASGGGKTLSDYAASMPDWANWTSSTSPSTKERRIYLTDVKTRGVSTKPPSASSIGFRPTLLQLHLYYHMLTRMATSDDVTMEFIAARHRLKPERPFSDGLIAQVGSLDNQFLNIESSPTSNSDSEDALNVLLQHNSLSKLWALMKEHMRLTFLPSSQFPEASSTHGHPQSVESNIEKPNTVSPPTILSPLLTATYVSSHTDPSDPTHYLGSRSFYFDANDLYPYLADGMRFWRGRRSAKGVGMVEAWKCVICEFRDECEWRAAREKEASLRGSRKVRKKKSSGGKKSEDEGEKD